MNDKISILIAAGGTGGHLFPAIAVCEQLTEITNGKCEFHFVGTADKIESRVVPSLGYNFHPIKIGGIKKSPAILLLPFQIASAINKCRKIILNNNISAVIATGAYLSFPPGYAASLHKLPLFLLESNVRPGKAIKSLCKYATKIITSFDESTNYFDKSFHNKIVALGNPIRKQFLDFPDQKDARNSLGIPLDKKTIFIFGGSLGAASINKAVEKHLDSLLERGYFVLWQTGRNYKFNGANHNNLIVKEFIDNIADYYSAADLVVCRSGATTVWELTVAAKPAILVPLPSASNNEQLFNAEILKKNGAAEIILNDQIETKLLETINSVLTDDALARMSSAARKLARPNAARDVAFEVLKTIGYEL
ncbi:MAG: undecaprenyldiphospho-muramoylpentapeptide beta-N-acetylglucosaminyltransferase [Bacteroidota bacterium]